jgi:hypothetical protein
VKTASSFSAAKHVRAIDASPIQGGVWMAIPFAGPSIDPMGRNLAAAVARNRETPKRTMEISMHEFLTTIFGT